MNTTCEHCNKIFSTKSNLVKHQTKTRKCLTIQNKVPETVYSCVYCKKEFVSKDAYNSHLTRHAIDPLFQSEERNRVQKERHAEEIIKMNEKHLEEIIKMNEKHAEEIEQIKSRHTNELEIFKMKCDNKIADVEMESNIDYSEHTLRIKMQEETIKDLRNNNKHLSDQIVNLTEQIRSMETERKTLTKLAINKSTTNNTYITNNILSIDKFTPINSENIRIYKDNLSIEYITSFKKGGEGLAKYLMDYPLKDNIFCTDKSRHKLKYRRENAIISDYKARNLWDSAILNVLYEDIFLKIDVVIRNLKENNNVSDEIKIRYEHEYLSLKYDLQSSKETGRMTPTQESFIVYLISNVDTKEELMNKFSPLLSE